MSQSILRGVTSKDQKSLVRKALKAGCMAEVSGGTHLILTTPSGVRVRAAMTSGDRNSFRNLRRELERHGVHL